MINCILIHYHEIALKGGNRYLFENQLKENIKKALGEFGVKVVSLRGRILVKLINIRTSDVLNIKDSNFRTSKVLILTREKLQRVFGIANFSFCYGSILSTSNVHISTSHVDRLKIIDEIKNKIWEFIRDKKFASFKIETKRASKDFPFDSREINEIIGAFIKEKSGAKVDLENPELTCFIEIVGRYFFIYDEKIPGAGGLPVGVSGKVISLISSGLDSPVASWYLMKRGAHVVYVHFHSYPQTTLVSKENVENLVKILNDWQFESKIYFVPFLEIQKKIILETPENLRVILYRRQMVKIANEIARKENTHSANSTSSPQTSSGQALGLVTGDSLGQVASQTLENLNTISAASDLPIYRPLIGMDKEEIINIAKKIGTFEISIKPYEDCCNLFTPAHPATKSDPKEIEKIEKKIKLYKLIKKAISEIKIRTY